MPSTSISHCPHESCPVCYAYTTRSILSDCRGGKLLDDFDAMSSLQRICMYAKYMHDCRRWEFVSYFDHDELIDNVDGAMNCQALLQMLMSRVFGTVTSLPLEDVIESVSYSLDPVNDVFCVSHLDSTAQLHRVVEKVVGYTIGHCFGFISEIDSVPQSVVCDLSKAGYRFESFPFAEYGLVYSIVRKHDCVLDDVDVIAGPVGLYFLLDDDVVESYYAKRFYHGGLLVCPKRDVENEPVIDTVAVIYEKDEIEIPEMVSDTMYDEISECQLNYVEACARHVLLPLTVTSVGATASKIETDLRIAVDRVIEASDVLMFDFTAIDIFAHNYNAFDRYHRQLLALKYRMQLFRGGDKNFPELREDYGRLLSSFFVDVDGSVLEDRFRLLPILRYIKKNFWGEESQRNSLRTNRAGIALGSLLIRAYIMLGLAADDRFDIMFEKIVHYDDYQRFAYLCMYYTYLAAYAADRPIGVASVYVYASKFLSFVQISHFAVNFLLRLRGRSLEEIKSLPQFYDHLRGYRRTRLLSILIDTSFGGNLSNNMKLVFYSQYSNDVAESASQSINVVDVGVVKNPLAVMRGFLDQLRTAL